MQKFIFNLVLFLLISNYGQAKEFVYSAECQKAYQCFLAMKIDEGKNHLLKESSTNKENILPFILINYEDFISLCFNENPSLYKKQKPLFEQRLKLVDYGPKNSPYFLFCKALLHYQWCIIRIKHGDYWDAAWDFRKSYLLFKENKEKFPGFKQNNVFIGTQEAIMSTIPKGYKWVTSILGLHGNMLNGMKQIRAYIDNGSPELREEACFYYIYLKNYLENDPKGAASLISTLKLDIVNNQLFSFMASNLAINNKKAVLAESILNHRRTGSEYMELPMLNYEMATAKLRQLDFKSTDYFNRFLATYKGHFYVKDAYYHLALTAFLQGNTKQANSYLDKLLISGKSESDADKQAQKFAQKRQFPHKELLKARLLNDGGNNEEALIVLARIENKIPLNSSEKLEFFYRYGRVYDDLEQKDKALANYAKSIELGSKSTEYYASRAALQSAYIYEERHEIKKAITYFNMVLDMDNHEYKNSIDQRAKAGLNRINGK